ncbi:TlpA family protein disulfide reductase [Ekhidna sp.]|uniref:TlpA family protein disulfide reductase n=1 Tax=Ekhidna sp. TaxID=2608089 RepID=UPI003CCC2A81
MNLKTLVFTLFLFFYCWNLPAQSFKVGDKFPSLEEVNWYNENNRAKENMPMIIDFWFIQCAPCIWSLPHFNELVNQYATSDVAFFALTFDDKESLKKFLTKKEVVATIGMYEEEQSSIGIGVDYFPTALVIDEDRIIRWKGHTSHLNEQIIDSILFKNSRNIVKGSLRSSYSNQEVSFQKPGIEITINDYSMGSSGYSSDSKEISFVNKSIEEILSQLSGTTRARVEVAVADTTKFDLRYVLEKKKGTDPIWKDVVDHMGLESKIVEKDVDGMELSISNVYKLDKSSSDKVRPGFSSYSDLCLFEGFTLKMLAHHLEDTYKVVFSSNDEDEKYDFKLPCNDFELTRKILETIYGVRLTEKEMTVSILSVYKRN